MLPPGESGAFFSLMLGGGCAAMPAPPSSSGSLPDPHGVLGWGHPPPKAPPPHSVLHICQKVTLVMESQLHAVLGTLDHQEVPTGGSQSPQIHPLPHCPGRDRSWARAGQVFYWKFTDTRALSRVTAWRRGVREGGVRPQVLAAPPELLWEAPTEALLAGGQI